MHYPGIELSTFGVAVGNYGLHIVTFILQKLTKEKSYFELKIDVLNWSDLVNEIQPYRDGIGVSTEETCTWLIIVDTVQLVVDQGIWTSYF
jgi:hypothetical protein